LRQLRADCDRVISRISEVEVTDAANREANTARTLRGLGLSVATLGALAALATLLAIRAAGALCEPGAPGGACASDAAQRLLLRDAWVEPAFAPLVAAALAAALLLAAAAKVVWRHAPVLSKREQRRLEEFREVARAVARANEALYEAYFSTIASREER
jgi:hypothetical protein